MRIPSILLAQVVFALEVATASYTANWCNQYFCITAHLDTSHQKTSSQTVTSLQAGTSSQAGTSPQSVTFHISARRDVGWLGVGTGYGMEGSKMVLLWKGLDGCITSERDGVSCFFLEG